MGEPDEIIALCTNCNRKLGTYLVTSSQPQETQERRVEHLLKTHVCKEIADAPSS